MNAPASDPALDAIKRHAQAVNQCDADAYLASTTFPFTYQNYNGVALTVEDPEEYGLKAPFPWEIIQRTDPDWSHSEFVGFELVARSISSAVYKVSFRRVDKGGEASETYDAIWIAVEREAGWGVQFRHNLGLSQPST